MFCLCSSFCLSTEREGYLGKGNPIAMVETLVVTSVHKHSADMVRVQPTLKLHTSGALTLRDTLRKIFLKFLFFKIF